MWPPKQRKMDCLKTLSAVKSSSVTDSDIFCALLSACGARVGGMSAEGDRSYSNKWEWFDPQLMTEDDYSDLPEHWQAIVRNQNQECWNLGYKYIHAPVEILASYPRVAVKGIFGVMDNNATPETVTANELIHIGGQFTEYDTKDKCIWQKNVRAIQEQGVEQTN